MDPLVEHDLISEDLNGTKKAIHALQPFPWTMVLRFCALGFFVNCQPSEPFLTLYLKEVKGISEHDLDDYVWPFDTYGSFALLIPVGLFAELVGYRCTIFLGLIFREVTRLVLLYADGADWAAFMQFTYAGATAVNSVYFAYVYMVFHEDHFTMATSAVLGSYHLGNVFGSILGQVLMDHTSVQDNVKILFYISWGCTSLGVACFFALPVPCRSPPPSLATSIRVQGIWKTGKDLVGMYQDYWLCIWSCWWVFGLCTHSIISNYYQNQFYDIEPDGKFGYVEAIMELFSAVGASSVYVLGPLLLSPRVAIPLIYVFVSSTAACYFLSTFLTQSILYSYMLNTAAVVSYAVLNSVASVSISARLAAGSDINRRYALVFTINSFLALGFATILLQAGSAKGWDTTVFYRAASVLEVALLVVALPLLFAAFHGPCRLFQAPKANSGHYLASSASAFTIFWWLVVLVFLLVGRLGVQEFGGRSSVTPQ